jgi:hypothetical protein
MLNRMYTVICFHNCDETHAAVATLVEQGVRELDEIDDDNPAAVWIAVDVITDLSLDQMDFAVRPFHGVVVEIEKVRDKS